METLDPGLWRNTMLAVQATTGNPGSCIKGLHGRLHTGPTWDWILGGGGGGGAWIIQLKCRCTRIWIHKPT